MKNKFSITYPDGSHMKTVPERTAPVQKAIATSPDQPGVRLVKPGVRLVKVITLPLYGIRIEDDGKNVVVTSCLQATNPHEYRDGVDEMNGEHMIWKAKMTAIESLIKHHYMSGVNVTSKRYIKGIEDYVDYMKVHK